MKPSLRILDESDETVKDFLMFLTQEIRGNVLAIVTDAQGKMETDQQRIMTAHGAAGVLIRQGIDILTVHGTEETKEEYRAILHHIVDTLLDVSIKENTEYRKTHFH